MKLTKLESLPSLDKITRVAAYARVSTEKAEALSSLANQIEHYRHMFAANPNYVLVGVFSDNGISGAKSARPEFQKMIEMAKNGEIDLIYTKSISRFSRNLMTTLQIIKELKAIDVGIYFEEQRMNTLDNKSEFTLNLLSVFAETELKSMSGNMRWRIMKDYEEGKLWGGGDYTGYKIVNRRYVLDPETAPIVRRIYDMYLSGIGDHKIAKLLELEGVPTTRGGKWGHATIQMILTNRNYTGDLVLQRTYTKDYKSTRHLNKGQADYFVVENDHEPIIDKETFLNAQILRSQKAKMHNTEKPKQKVVRTFSDLLYCGICGHQFHFKKGPYHNHYLCATFVNYGKRRCQSKQIRESILESVTKSTLGLEEINNDILKKKLRKIIIKPDNMLTYILKNDEEITVHWDDPKRSDGWTDEMKDKMRTISSKRKQPRAKNGHWMKKGENNANSN